MSAGPGSWLHVDWREHLRWVTIGGRPMALAELGEGPPLVLLHGHGGAWTNWLQQIPAFAATHRVVAPDLPGFGRSPLPAGKVTISGYARLIDELLARLGIESSAAVVGNSMGGFVGAELAIRFPERVERLVLVSAAGVSTRYLGIPVRFQALRAIERCFETITPLTRVSQRRARAIAARPRLRRGSLGLVARHPERLHPALVWELVRGAGRPGAAPAAADIARYDFRHRLCEIACPTLIVWGAQDAVVPAWCADVFDNLIPHTRKVVFDDTGHVPMIERPDEFNALLSDFLTAEEGA